MRPPECLLRRLRCVSIIHAADLVAVLIQRQKDNASWHCDLVM